MNAPEPHPKMERVAFDFDGILAENTWPSPAIGEPIQDGIDLLLHYHAQGLEIVIYTARPQSHEKRIWWWLEWYGLHEKVYDVVCGKPVAGLYIDDRAWNPTKEEGWPETRVSTQS